MRMTGKAALVTGGASGLGEAIAKRFAEEGARVAIVDIDGPKAEKVAAEIGDSAMAIACDVSSLSQVRSAVEKTITSFGQIDVVVNNAGWSNANQPLWQASEEVFDRIFSVNVKSIFNMAQAVVPHMCERRSGAIINVGSTGGINPRPGLVWYNGSKAAVNCLAKAMAIELAQYKIRVNAIAPTMAMTPLLETFMGKPLTSENSAEFEATIPLGRFCKPKDVADAALFLASEEADFITGIILPVCGGRTI